MLTVVSWNSPPRDAISRRDFAAVFTIESLFRSSSCPLSVFRFNPPLRGIPCDNMRVLLDLELRADDNLDDSLDSLDLNFTLHHEGDRYHGEMINKMPFYSINTRQRDRERERERGTRGTCVRGCGQEYIPEISVLSLKDILYSGSYTLAHRYAREKRTFLRRTWHTDADVDDTAANGAAAILLAPVREIFHSARFPRRDYFSALALAESRLIARVFTIRGRR